MIVLDTMLRICPASGRLGPAAEEPERTIMGNVAFADDQIDEIDASDEEPEEDDLDDEDDFDDDDDDEEDDEDEDED